MWLSVCILLHFFYISSQTPRLNVKPDYSYLTDMYSEITMITSFLNNNVGIFIFISVHYNAYLMYFGLNIFNHHNNNLKESHQNLLKKS